MREDLSAGPLTHFGDVTWQSRRSAVIPLLTDAWGKKQDHSMN